MARQIIKQPNKKHKKFGLWSSTINHFLYVNLTEEDLVQCLLEENEKKIRQSIHNQIEKLNSDKKDHVAWRITWEEALNLIKENYGENKLKSFLELFTLF